MDWCRLWHDAPDDPKWRLIARKAGVRVGDVWAVFTRMLVRASASSERGSIAGWDDEVEAIALDFEPHEIVAIREAMQGRVLDGNKLSGWSKRQPKREREDDSAERVREHRDRLKEQESANLSNVTPCNATPEHETPRVDERREDKKEEDSLSAVRQQGAADVRQAVDAWNAMASRVGLSVIQRVTDPRRRAIGARLRECGGIGGWHEAMRRIEATPWMHGENKTGWRADIDFVCRPSKFTKLMEGAYDHKPAGPQKPSPNRYDSDLLKAGGAAFVAGVMGAGPTPAGYG